MRDDTFLIYVDILGFENLLEKLGKQVGREPRRVRKDFIDTIQDRIHRLEITGKIAGKKYSQSDDWLLVADTTDQTIESIAEIMNHNTGYTGLEQMPLEIAVATAEYDSWAQLSGEGLTCEDSTIDMLKIDILKNYHAWHKHVAGSGVRHTFVVLTQSAYERLEPLDRSMCREVAYVTQNNRSRKEVGCFYSIDIGHIRRRARMFQFLKKIGAPGNRFYDRIDQLFVRPLEYAGILQALRKQRIVFITGTAEYGKTYAAVRLLWEYFERGYEPVWWSGGEEMERQHVRKKMEDIESQLKPRRVIYFEDPFGKTEYERRESLEREIGNIIETVQGVPDVYVVVTSREEVFKRFEEEQLSAVELRRFEKKLSIKKPSYDDTKRREMLLGWATAKDCQWLKYEFLVHLVLKRLGYKRSLPTPLSIRSFAASTTTTLERTELVQKMKEKSAVTAKAFAREIEDMSRDQVLFLSFLFVSEFPVEFLRAQYAALVQALRLREASEFGRLVKWFGDDKIEVREKRLLFSHPSYREALKYVLVEEGASARANKSVFAKVLLHLAQTKDGAAPVVFVVAAHFGDLPATVRNLLSALAERVESAWAVPRAVAQNYERLPPNIQELLLKLSRKPDAGQHVAPAVARNFDRLPAKVRKLLRELSQRKETAGSVAFAIANNFRRLPEDVRQLLFVLSDRDHAAPSVVRGLTDNYARLPAEARKVLVHVAPRDATTASAAVFGIAHNYGDLPEEVTHLFLDLCDRPEIGWAVARAIAHNFHKLPQNVRNVLFRLSGEESAAGHVAWAVAHNFGNLPQEVRQLLFDLSEADRAAPQVALAVAKNYKKLPPEARSLLTRLGDKVGLTGSVANAVRKSFSYMPRSVAVALLLKLARNDDGTVATAWALAENFDKVPAGVRQELVSRLLRNPDRISGVAYAIVSNLDKLPQRASNRILLRLAETDEAASAIAYFLSKNFRRIPAPTRDRLLLALAVKPKSAATIASLLRANFDRVPPSVRNRLLVEFAQNERTATRAVGIVVQNLDKVPPKLRTLVDTLQSAFQELLLGLATSRSTLQKKQALQLMRSAGSKLDEDFLLPLLEKLSEDGDDGVRAKAKQLIETEFSGLTD